MACTVYTVPEMCTGHHHPLAVHVPAQNQPGNRPAGETCSTHGTIPLRRYWQWQYKEAHGPILAVQGSTWTEHTDTIINTDTHRHHNKYIIQSHTLPNVCYLSVHTLPNVYKKAAENDHEEYRQIILRQGRFARFFEKKTFFQRAGYGVAWDIKGLLVGPGFVRRVVGLLPCWVPGACLGHGLDCFGYQRRRNEVNLRSHYFILSFISLFRNFISFATFFQYFNDICTEKSIGS